MLFFNIHTHRLSSGSSRVEILNLEATDSPTTLPAAGFYSCGIHPQHLLDADAGLKTLETLLAEQKIVAIGEAGFEPVVSSDVRAEQYNLFAAQAALSERFQLPLVVHCIKSWEILLAAHSKLKPLQTWIIHGFRGKPQLAQQLLRRGFYLSFGVHFNSQAAAIIPFERIFCETDCAEAEIESVYDQLCAVRGVSSETLCRQIEENVQRVFNLY